VIGRLIRVEFATVRRSFVVWLALLLVIGGSVVARTLTWLSHALGRSQIGSLLLMNPISGWSDAAIPLMLLAYLIVTAYLFGRDFEDGNADLTLTAPVPRGAVVIVRMAVVATGLVMISLLGWAADVAMRALLATSAFDPGEATSAAAVLGASIAAIATLPLVAWAAIRSRGVLPALGLGIGLQVSVRVLAGFAPVRLLPWFLPTTLAAGGVPSWSSIALALLLFAGGLAATVRGFRNVDLYE
jgi:hypothetical protein